MESWLSARKLNFPFPQTVFSSLFNHVTERLSLAGKFNGCKLLCIFIFYFLEEKKKTENKLLTVLSVSFLTRCGCHHLGCYQC